MNSEPRLCEKLKYGNPANPDILLGIILEDKDGFIVFKTKNKTRSIYKNSIISLEHTTEIFNGEDE